MKNQRPSSFFQILKETMGNLLIGLGDIIQGLGGIMEKNLILIVLMTLFIMFAPNASSDGCDDHGPKGNVECIKDSDGNCVET